MTVGDLMGSLNKADGMTIQSPLPDGPVVIDIAHFTLTYTPEAAQSVQTVIANFYDTLGYQVAFSKKGVLVIGQKICECTVTESKSQGATLATLKAETAKIKADPKHKIGDPKLLAAFQYCAIELLRTDD